MFENEEQLREPIRAWVSKQGLVPVDERYCCGKIPDVIGLDGEEIKIAIEMKLSNWKSALYQAMIYHNFTKRSYVAMPEAKANVLTSNIDEFKRWNVGILLVSETSVSILYEPSDNL